MSSVLQFASSKSDYKAPKALASQALKSIKDMPFGVIRLLILVPYLSHKTIKIWPKPDYFFDRKHLTMEALMSKPLSIIIVGGSKYGTFDDEFYPSH